MLREIEWNHIITFMITWIEPICDLELLKWSQVIEAGRDSWNQIAYFFANAEEVHSMGNQFSSVAKSSPTLYYPMDCSIMGNSKLLNSGENMERNVLFSILLWQGCRGKIKSLKCLYDKLYFLDSFIIKQFSYYIIDLSSLFEDSGY